jgi:mRNA-degrading endonuclease RelE of RelBE toxin-antitoxin system
VNWRMSKSQVGAAPMVDVNFEVEPKNPCSEQKAFCVNCHSHFMAVRPHIRSVLVTKRFFKDLKDPEEAKSIVRDVLECSNIDFNELHKFEEQVSGNMIFRAKKEGMHIVYCVDKSMRIIFLRVFRNFNEYEKFLENKKEIGNLILHAHAV